MRTSKKAIVITLLVVMLISTFAVLGINPVSAKKPDQTPQVTYINGYPYISQDQLRNAQDVSQNASKTPAAQPHKAYLASNQSSKVYGNATVAEAVAAANAIEAQKRANAQTANQAFSADSASTSTITSPNMMLDNPTGLTISISADDPTGEDTYSRDSDAYVSTTIDASGGHALCHWEARLLRQTYAHNIDGTVVVSDVRWIATQSIGNDVYWEGPSDWTPTFTESQTLSELYGTGTYYISGGSNLDYNSVWENWNRVTVYRIEIKQIGVGQSDGELIGVTDFNSYHSMEYDGINPYFGSWAIGHGEMQRFANSVTRQGCLWGSGRIDYASNILGGQDWNWGYMDGYGQWDTSYLQFTFPDPYNGYGYLADGFEDGHTGDLYLFSYIWSGYPSNLWLYQSWDSGSTFGMGGGYVPYINDLSGWCFWSGQVSWTYQHWTRFTAGFWIDQDYLTIFQQTPTGHYGSNFSIDSIVQEPMFVQPNCFT